MRNAPLLVAAAAFVAANAFAQIPAPTGRGVMLNAAELLPANQLRGTSYRVRNQTATWPTSPSTILRADRHGPVEIPLAELVGKVFKTLL